MERILITGANRGIGLELVRQYAAKGASVVATCRDAGSADALNAIAESADVTVIEVEVTDTSSVDHLRQALHGKPLDVLINNAGIAGGPQSTAEMDYAAWADTFAVNTMAPFRVFNTLKRNLLMTDRPRAVTVSSTLGALHDTARMGYAYQTSKAAVNKLMQVLAGEVADDNIIAVPVHPGWVRTDMGGPNADISVEESAAGLIALIDGLTMAQSGKFWNWDGRELDW